MRLNAPMFRLQNPVMNYAWGSPSAIAALQGRETQGDPEAELWMGAHPHAPSSLHVDGDRVVLGERLFSDAPNLLGESCRAEFGARLPFLFKVLAAAEPLSIQAHPNLAEAKSGFEREEGSAVPRSDATRTYRDANHKPELLCALTEFHALCGFRPTDELTLLLTELGLGDTEFFRDGLTAMRRDSETGLRQLVSSILTDPRICKGVLPDVLRAAATQGPRSNFAEACAWLVRIGEKYPQDPGVVLSVLLNYVKLQPEEAVYLAAGVPHAYLHGTAVEIMANSDNVIRGGLTTKHVDVKELLQILVVNTRVNVLRPQASSLTRYLSPAKEFELWRIEVNGDACELPSSRGPQIVLCVEGHLTLSALDQDASLELARGQSAFVSGTTRNLSVTGRGKAYRAGLPSLG